MKRLLVGLLLLLVSLGAWGQYTETFYVSTGGDGSLPETNNSATCWDLSDFNTAGNWAVTDTNDGKIGPNDLVLFFGGTYQGATMVPVQDGLNGKPITFQGHTGGAAIFDGQDTRQSMDLDDRDYLTFDGLEFTQGANFGVDGWDVTNLTFTNCYFHDSYYTGSGAGTNLYLYGSDILIQYCEFASATYDHGLYFGGPGSSDNIIIEYSYFHDNEGAGITLNTGSTSITNVVIRFNWFDGNGWAGVDEQCGDTTKIYGNIFVQGNGGAHGVVVEGDGSGAAPTGTLVYNNTIYGDYNTGVGIGWTGSDTVTGVNATNNIIYNTNGGGSHYYFAAWDTGDTFSGNDTNQFYNPSTPTAIFATQASGTPVEQNTLGAWQSAASVDTNSDIGDPDFVAAITDDFTLDPASPAIDEGTDLGDSYDEGLDEDVVKTDFGVDGSITLVDRDAGGSTGDGWDRGAYEMDAPSSAVPLMYYRRQSQ